MVPAVWNMYTNILLQYPLRTKTMTAAIIFFSSDVYQQKQQPQQPFQWSRAIGGAAFGVVGTTFVHYWWTFLEPLVEFRLIPMQRNRLANTLVKVGLDQTLGAPLYIYTYYVLTNYIQTMLKKEEQHDDGGVLTTWNKSYTKANSMLWPTMIQHWQVWPMVHCVNFYFIPFHHRVIVQNFVLVLWSGYLSHWNHSGNVPSIKDTV